MSGPIDKSDSELQRLLLQREYVLQVTVSSCAEFSTYLALDAQTNTDVLIKKFNAEAHSRGVFARLQHDAELRSRLHVPGLPRFWNTHCSTTIFTLFSRGLMVSV
jgi:hypothetical protein